jgi:homoserine kinase
MPLVRVTVPATALNLGPGIDCLGLALALHNTVEMSLRDDDEQRVLVYGASEYAGTLVLRSVELIMNLINRPLPGLNVNCLAFIPERCGLGDEEAWLIGGLMAINNLLGAPLHREQIAEIGAKLSPSPAAAITSLLGGLTVTNPVSVRTAELFFRRLDVATLRLVVVVPNVPHYRTREAALKRPDLTYDYLRANLSNAVLVAEALRKADFRLLGRLLTATLDAGRIGLIPGATEALAAAARVGAVAATLSGPGPALIVFTPTEHHQVEAEVTEAFAAFGVTCRTWSLAVDTQGVAISLQA